MRKIAWASSAFLFVIAIGWYSGTDFGQRGPSEALWLLYSAVVAGYTYYIVRK